MREGEKISHFHGVANIVRFNWPIYVFVLILVSGLLSVSFLPGIAPAFQVFFQGLAMGISAFTLLTLFVSFYIYDLSELNTYTWLNKIELSKTGNFANIHSGFDETSASLKKRFPSASWKLCDFYNPLYNTEGSIKRARKKYPCPPETIVIDHKDWKLEPDSYSAIFCLFAVHEIRSLEEKQRFFAQAAIHLKSGGKLVMAEHQRDLANFLVFGHGAFHFFCRAG